MSSGNIKITPGFLFNETEGELLTYEKLNRILGDAVLRVAASAITAREIADGTITADKLAENIAAQFGVGDGAVTTAKLANNAVTSEKILDGTITNDDLALGAVFRNLTWLSNRAGYAHIGELLIQWGNVPPFTVDADNPVQIKTVSFAKRYTSGPMVFLTKRYYQPSEDTTIEINAVSLDSFTCVQNAVQERPATWTIGAGAWYLAIGRRTLAID